MRVAIAAILSIVVGHAAIADPVVWPAASGGNDHAYEIIVANSLLWADARAAAELHDFEGVPGHLATLVSSAENDFVADRLPPPSGNRDEFWLGAYQPDGGNPAIEPALGWEWITGEPWTYTNWRTGEPNNLNNAEHCLGIRTDPNRGFWNDEGYPPLVQAFIRGYVIEYPVPEPSSSILLLAATAFAARRAR